MSYTRISIVICALIIIVLIAAAAQTRLSSVVSPAGEVEMTLTIKDATFNVMVADSSFKRARGLSGTAMLSEQSGMWFVFDEDNKHGIWMKEMLYPIDIIWADASLTIIDIVKNAEPESYNYQDPWQSIIFQPSTPARYVLEVNAGVVDRHDIEIGDHIVVQE